MATRGKRYRESAALQEADKNYEPGEAISLVKKGATAKFDETVDISTCLNVDPRKADQIVRGTVVLPHGTGKVTRVLVIAQGEKETEATEAGADLVKFQTFKAETLVTRTAEKAEYQKNLSNILDLVDQLSAVDTSSVEPMAHPLDAVQRLRADVVTEENNRDHFQQIAPQTENGYYLVPRVVE